MNWRNPYDILAHQEYQSDPMNTIPLLLAFDGDKYPRVGWYIASIDEWRQEGSPSSFSPIAWQPMPDMPKQKLKA